jgi:hypothetical protein
MVEANSKRWVMLLLFAVFAVTLVAVPQGSAYAAECDGQWPDSASCNRQGPTTVATIGQLCATSG